MGCELHVELFAPTPTKLLFHGPVMDPVEVKYAAWFGAQPVWPELIP